MNERQEAFCREYLIDLNGGKAAVRAGYSKNSAEQAASRLLRDPRINSRIAELMSERSERVKADAAYLLSRLVDEAEADLADLYYPCGGLKPIHEWPLIWRKGLVAGVDIEQQFIQEDGEKKPDGYIVKVKLSDRVRRLELIGKHVDIQAFIDRAKVEVNDTSTRGFGDLSPEERALIQAARRQLEEAAAAGRVTH